MATVNIDLSEFAGNNELQREILTGLVLDNHQPVNLVERAEVYGVLGDEAALGVQVAIDPADGRIQGSCFRFLGRNNAEIFKTSVTAKELWKDCSKGYKLNITIGVIRNKVAK